MDIADCSRLRTDCPKSPDADLYPPTDADAPPGQPGCLLQRTNALYAGEGFAGEGLEANHGDPQHERRLHQGCAHGKICAPPITGANRPGDWVGGAHAWHRTYCLNLQRPLHPRFASSPHQEPIRPHEAA